MITAIGGSDRDVEAGAGAGAGSGAGDGGGGREAGIAAANKVMFGSSRGRHSLMPLATDTGMPGQYQHHPSEATPGGQSANLPNSQISPRTRNRDDALEAGLVPPSGRTGSNNNNNNNNRTARGSALAGRMLPNERHAGTAVKAKTVSERKFIPLDLAAETVNRMQQDMHAMHMEHRNQVAALERHYSDLNDNNSLQYMEYIAQLKAAAMQRMAQYKSAFRRASMQMKAAHDSLANEVADLEDQLAQVRHEKLQVQQAAADDIQRIKQENDEMLRAIRNEHAKELARLRENADGDAADLRQDLAEQKEILDEVRRSAATAEVDAAKALAATQAALEKAEQQLAARNEAVATLEAQRHELLDEQKALSEQCAASAARQAELESQVAHAEGKHAQLTQDWEAKVEETKAQHAAQNSRDTETVVLQQSAAPEPASAAPAAHGPPGEEVQIIVPRDGLTPQQVVDAAAFAEQRIADLEAATQEHAKKERQLHVALEDVSTQLATNKEAIAAWNAEFEEREGRPAEKADKAEIRELYSENRTLKREADGLVQSIEGHSTKAATAAKHLPEARAALEFFKARIVPGASTTVTNTTNTTTVQNDPALVELAEKLQGQVAELQAASGASEAREQQLVADLEEARAQLAESRSELDATKLELGSAQREKADAEDRAELLQKRLESAQRVADGEEAVVAASEVELIQTALDQALHDKEAAQTTAAEATQRAASLSTQLEDKQQAVETLQSQVDAATAHSALLQAELATAKSQAAAAPAVTVAAAAAPVIVAGNDDAAQAEIQALKESVAEAEEKASRVPELEDALAEAQEQVEAERAAREELEIQMQLTEAEAAAAKAEAAAAKASAAGEESEVLARWVPVIKETLSTGREQWNAGKHSKCISLYTRICNDLCAELPEGSMKNDMRKALDRSAKSASQPSRQAFAMRKGMEKFIAAAEEAQSSSGTEPPSAADAAELEATQAQVAALKAQLEAAKTAKESKASGAGAGAGAGAGVTVAAVAAPKARSSGPRITPTQLKQAEARAKAAEAALARTKAQLAETKEELAAAQKKSKSAKGRGDGAASGVSAAKATKDAEKAKKLDGQVKELRAKLKAANDEAARVAKQASLGGKETEKALRQAERKLEADAKAHKKEVQELTAANEKAVADVTARAEKAERRADAAETDLVTMAQQKKALEDEVAKMNSMNQELAELREAATQLMQTKAALAEAERTNKELDELYRKEQVLRKRYWNMMEDMKGKIRVYCRCRPMSQSEIERGSVSVVGFPDDVTLELDTDRGTRQFMYDQCFGPGATQEEVFADTKNLVQSAFDGFNVCIFAYGQTGSGKTFTMTGYEGYPGITPRAVASLFDLAAANSGTCKTTVSCYMVELYNDKLVDLFFRVDAKSKRAEGPKLDIKVDKKGMVYIKNSIIKEVESAEELLGLFDAGNGVRHVGATKMNATSSRSHLVFSVLISVYNKQTKKTSTGKLSLVDLAGSERVGKTGANAERLREAQSINKSLSALGDVISDLSSNKKHIPYRNNKLTMMMQDSLGGNAKTLMFVNISPADYNADETSTSLSYASRVKLITNNANKNQDNEEVARLKGIIAKLKAGEAVDEDEA